MYNQTEAMLAKYEIEMKQTSKGRGSYICDTDQGQKELCQFRGSMERGEALKEFLQKISGLGLEMEEIMVSKEGTSVVRDEGTGESFLLRSVREGTKLDAHKWEDMKNAANLLGRYHSVSCSIPIEEVPMIFRETEENPLEDARRHHRELIRIRNQIRSKKKKNEFESLFLENCGGFIATAERALSRLESTALETLPWCMCHGDYNQHNVIRQGAKWYMVHMEQLTYAPAITDLAFYLRKLLEKNDWNQALGKSLIGEYEKQRNLSPEELQCLGALLLFPERFWKVTNHYMNSKKAWVSQRDIEKLRKAIGQEKVRLEFAEMLIFS